MKFTEQKLKELHRRERWETVGTLLTLGMWAAVTVFVFIGGCTVGGWLRGVYGP